MNETTWSKREKVIARPAFDLAYERECRSIAEFGRRASTKNDA
jgi:hypothetical protein